MRYSRLWVAASIIAIFIVTGFVLSVPHTRDVDKVLPPPSVAPSVPAISLHDSYKKGQHTITGMIEARNACTAVTAEAALLGEASSTTGILVKLSLQEDSGICLQEPTQMNFTTTVSAPAHVPITATINGVTATTTDI